MHLTDLWFTLIAVLWTGYLVLEGFDFGVGMLLPVVGREEVDRRVAINTIGPVWDGNEVWLLVAGGATFAAFPAWYATMFSGFYLALLLILVALILRGVAFEFRGKIDDPRWRRNWDRAIFFGSAVPALLWGVALSNVVRGVPVDAGGIFRGSLLTLLNPYALLGGLTTMCLFALHGAVFLGLKADGPVRLVARTLIRPLGAASVLLAAAFLALTQRYGGSWLTWLLALAAALSLLGGLAAALRGREGWAFAGTAGAIALASATLFTVLYPNVLPSTMDSANSLTVTNAASTPYTLGIMSWVALFCTPVVLAYQSYTYWVFRRRVGRQHIPAPARAVSDLPASDLPASDLPVPG